MSKSKVTDSVSDSVIRSPIELFSTAKNIQILSQNEALPDRRTNTIYFRN